MTSSRKTEKTFPLKATFEERTFGLPDLLGAAALDAAGFGVRALAGLDFFRFVFFAAISLRYHPCIESFGAGIQPEARNLGPWGSELHQIKDIKQSIWKDSFSRIHIESAGRKTRLEDEGPP